MGCESSKRPNWLPAMSEPSFKKSRPNPFNESSLYSDIRSAVVSKKASCCPFIVRLAWHSSGTYQKSDNTGGSNGARMRFAPESTDGANAGLSIARDILLQVKAKNPEVSLADIYTFAGKVAIEVSGGPTIPFKFGRTDDADGAKAVANGRLPDAALGAQHLRDVFYRMGFNDRDIVCLSGAHTLGSCHTNRSGFDGPWTFNPQTFDNSYFTLLLSEKWVERKWDGPKQYTDDKTKSLMMLPTDLALIKDEKFLPYVKKYAKDQALFFKDFAETFGKLLELGVPERKAEEKATDAQKASATFRDCCQAGKLDEAKAAAAAADVNEPEPGSGRTALIKAAFWGHPDVVAYLANELKLDVNAQDIEGDTALLEAAKFGHAKVVETLVAAGAKKDIRNRMGATALDVATYYGKEDIVKMLQ